MTTEKNESQETATSYRISDYREFVAISRELFNTAAFVYDTTKVIERNRFDDATENYNQYYQKQLAQVIHAASKKQLHLLDLLDNIIDFGPEDEMEELPKFVKYEPLGVLELPEGIQKLTSAHR